MRYIVEADRVFKKDPGKWNEDDEAFYDEYLEDCKKAGIKL